MLSRAILAGFCLTVACQHSQPRTTPVGIAGFARHSRFVDAKISPGGTYLAAISTDGGRRALSIVDLKTRKLASTFNPSRSRSAPSLGRTTTACSSSCGPSTKARWRSR